MLPHLIEAHHIEVAMAYVPLCSGHVLRRAKKQLLVAWTEADVAGKYRLKVSNLAQITPCLHFFWLGELEGDVGVLLGRDCGAGIGIPCAGCTDFNSMGVNWKEAMFSQPRRWYYVG